MAKKEENQELQEQVSDAPTKRADFSYEEVEEEYKKLRISAEELLSPKNN